MNDAQIIMKIVSSQLEEYCIAAIHSLFQFGAPCMYD